MNEVDTLFPCLLMHPVYIYSMYLHCSPPLPLFSSFKELKWSSELISSRLYKPLNRFCSSKQTIIQYPTNKQTNSRARKQTVHYVVFIQYYVYINTYLVHLVPIIKPHSEHFHCKLFILKNSIQKHYVSIFGTLF